MSAAEVYKSRASVVQLMSWKYLNFLKPEAELLKDFPVGSKNLNA